MAAEPDSKKRPGNSGKGKHKPENPVSAAVKCWLSTLEPADQGPLAHEVLVESAPKRWVVYEPLVLLPSGSFASPPWSHLLRSLTRDRLDSLWREILARISGQGKASLAHLAVNEGIPLHAEGTNSASYSDGYGGENILRSPSGLRILYGDFGPDATSVALHPSDEDFGRAFWVSTKQNGIYQTWAPRWTMFSRGNVKEKARLLGFHDTPPPSSRTPAEGGTQLSHRTWLRGRIKQSWAVDLYAGIGYFVFSFARQGMKVICWELNPWSVEGLRRGALKNGWAVKVVRGGDDLSRPTAELVAGGEQITILLEDNREAARRVTELRSQAGAEVSISHVNCGYLPSSQDSWRAAWEMATASPGSEGWLHLHENVGVRDIERRRKVIQDMFDAWDDAASGGSGDALTAVVEHVELVKTFAPDVWHCVFDVYITRSSRV